MQLLWLASIIAAISSVGVFIVNGAGVWYFMHHKERSLLAGVVTLLGISVSQLSIVIIPVDVYNASFSDSETYENMSLALQIGYYGIFLAVILLSCIAIPFAYFYTEASYVEDEDIPMRKKVITALKYTTVPIVIVVALLLVGLFLHTDHIADLIQPTEDAKDTKMENVFSRRLLQDVSVTQYNVSYSASSMESESEPVIVDADTNIAYGYLEQILSSNDLEYSITFAYCILTAVGFAAFWLTYTAMGMSGSAVLLLKGTKRLEGEVRDLQAQLETLQQTVEKIQDKHPGKMSDKIRKQFDDTNYEIEQIQSKLDYLEGEQVSSIKNTLKNLMKPFLFICGAFLMVVYGLVILSLLFTQIDRYRSSDCGWTCGFVMTSPQLILNPLDMVLTYSSEYFPLDVITFAIIVVFITFGTIAGLFIFGIRFFWVKLFAVKPRRTIPQALVASALIIMLCSICLMIEIFSIAPQYSTFGARTYITEDGDKVWCNMSAGAEACPMTQLAEIVNRFYASLSIAGIAFYFGTWIFIGTFFLGIVVSLFVSRSNVAAHVTEDEEDRKTHV